MKKETILLIARNVVNTDNIKEYLAQLGSYAVYDGGKKWIQSNLYKYIINNFKASKVTKAEEDSPTWLVDALASGQEVFHIKLTEKDKQHLRHVADYLNTEDKDWSRVSYPDMENHVKAWDKELKKQAKIESESDNFTSVLKVGNLQWVEVDTEEGLKDEGAKMGHCVGGYWNLVLSGRVKIFSLRDKNFGNPHVTIEISEVGYTSMWEVDQVKGNSNTIPDKYKKEITEFLIFASKKFKGLDINCYDVDQLKLDIYQIDGKLFESKDEASVYVLSKIKKLKTTVTITKHKELTTFKEYYRVLGSELYKGRTVIYNLMKRDPSFTGFQFELPSNNDPVNLTTEDLKAATKIVAKVVNLTILQEDSKKLMNILEKLDTSTLTLFAPKISSPVVIKAFPDNLKKSSVILRSDNFELDPDKRYIGTVKHLKSTVASLRNQLMAEKLHPESTKIKNFSYDKSKVKNKNLLKIIDAVETKTPKEVISLLKKIADNTVTVGYISTSIKFIQDLLIGLKFNPMALSKNAVIQLSETFKALLNIIASSSKLYSAFSYVVQGQVQKRGSGGLSNIELDRALDEAFRPYYLNPESYAGSTTVELQKLVENDKKKKIKLAKGSFILVRAQNVRVKKAFTGRIIAKNKDMLTINTNSYGGTIKLPVNSDRILGNSTRFFEENIPLSKISKYLI